MSNTYQHSLTGNKLE